jgi:putative AdoMet-dependent methyltransferase
MTGRNRQRLFDRWADHYDRSLRVEAGFPFEGYAAVLDEILHLTHPARGAAILDLGIGTGNLAVRFAAAGCRVWGLDFSERMLASAEQKLPQAVLAKADLLGHWPADFKRPFDAVVSAYVLHEFDLTTKLKLLQRIVGNHLAPDGKVVIGDIAFSSTAAREEGRRQWSARWDDAEHYWAADETAEACREIRISVEFSQISCCGGVFLLTPSGAAG